MASLRQMLKDKPVLLADGATGTTLFDMGLTSGDAPEEWNKSQPEKIRALHRGFVEAGSDIILTNTFGANARRLMLHNLQDEVFELNKRAAELAHEEVAKAGRPMVVAGSIGPTGDLFAPLGELTEEQAVEVFVDQMEGLKAGGADVIWIETMSALEEMRAAAHAAHRVGMDYVITASFDTAGRTMMGITPESLVEFMAALDPKPLAIGSNCGVGASDLLVSVLGMTAAEHDLPFVVVAKANCGIPQIQGENVVYTGTPELMERYAQIAMDTGARIIGGCCGTSTEHVKAMRNAIDRYHNRQAGEARPTLDEIVAEIGPLVSPAADASATGQGGGNRRRRRS